MNPSLTATRYAPSPVARRHVPTQGLRHHWLRASLVASALGGSLLLNGCAAPQVSDYATGKPTFDLRQYFDGTVDAYGVFTDRSGKVVKRFTVVMQGSWTTTAQGEEGMLDEVFTYADGSTSRRVWRLLKPAGGSGRYTGRADDVVGEAHGMESGNAFRWGYTMQLPVDGQTYEVQFDDWMYRMTDKVVLNKAEMRKFGIRLGEVTLAFSKR